MKIHPIHQLVIQRSERKEFEKYLQKLKKNIENATSTHNQDSDRLIIMEQNLEVQCDWLSFKYFGNYLIWQFNELNVGLGEIRQCRADIEWETIKKERKVKNIYLQMSAGKKLFKILDQCRDLQPTLLYIDLGQLAEYFDIPVYLQPQMFIFPSLQDFHLSLNTNYIGEHDYGQTLFQGLEVMKNLKRLRLDLTSTKINQNFAIQLMRSITDMISLIDLDLNLNLGQLPFYKEELLGCVRLLPNLKLHFLKLSLSYNKLNHPFTHQFADSVSQIQTLRILIANFSQSFFTVQEFKYLRRKVSGLNELQLLDLYMDYLPNNMVRGAPKPNSRRILIDNKIFQFQKKKKQILVAGSLENQQNEMELSQKRSQASQLFLKQLKK